MCHKRLWIILFNNTNFFLQNTLFLVHKLFCFIKKMFIIAS